MRSRLAAKAALFASTVEESFGILLYPSAQPSEGARRRSSYRTAGRSQAGDAASLATQASPLR
jgi:hypothetical protein